MHSLTSIRVSETSEDQRIVASMQELMGRAGRAGVHGLDQPSPVSTLCIAQGPVVYAGSKTGCHVEGSYILYSLVFLIACKKHAKVGHQNLV